MSTAAAPQNPAAPTQLAADPVEVKKLAKKLAAQRNEWEGGIKQLATKFGLDQSVVLATYDEHDGDDDGGIEARRIVLEMVVAKSQAAPTNGAQRAEVGEDAGDKRIKLAAAAILQRALGTAKLEQAIKLDAEARRPLMEGVSAGDSEIKSLARLSLNEIGMKSILASNSRLNAQSFWGLRPNEVADVVIGKTTLTGMHTRSDFASVVEMVMQVGLRQQFKAKEQSWKRNSRLLNQDSFEAKKYFGGGRFPAFLDVKEGGTFKRGSWGTSSYDLELEKGGRIVSWTKELQLADRVDMITQMLADAADAAVRYEKRKRKAVIIANLMPDGVTSFFDTDNTSATTGTPSVALLKAGMIMLAGLAAPGTAAVDSEPVQDDSESGEFPAFWHVGMADHIDASQLLGDGFTPTAASGAPTDEMRRLREGLVLDTWLESQSPPFSMLTLDPNTLAAFGHGYLTSEGGPVFERQQGFEVEGFDFKASIAFNFWLLERLAAVKLKRS